MIRATALSVVFGIVACGGSVSPADPDGASGNAGTKSNGASAGTAPNEADAGKPGVGGSVSVGLGGSNAGGSSVGGAAGAANACVSPRNDAPGEPVYDAAERGAGECATTTLTAVLEQIHAARPDLADVANLFPGYGPEDEGQRVDGSYVYAFRRADGGFAVALERGSGDCLAGCIVHDYWYFETGPGCTIEEVGEAHRDFQRCMEPDQLPRWGVPYAARPDEICGADLSPQDLNGTWSVVTCGDLLACTLSKEEPKRQALPGELSLSIEQDPADLSQGSVSLQGTGVALLDGRIFPAKFERSRVRVEAQSPQEPSICLENWTLSLDYDFEGITGRRINFTFAQTPDCEGAPQDYCKGQLNADLGDAHSQ